MYSGATWLQILTFGWLGPLLQMSFKRPLQESDMTGIPSSLKSEIIYKRFESFWNKEKEKKT
jgi:hypothetical protein